MCSVGVVASFFIRHDAKCQLTIDLANVFCNLLLNFVAGWALQLSATLHVLPGVMRASGSPFMLPVDCGRSLVNVFRGAFSSP